MRTNNRISRDFLSRQQRPKLLQMCEAGKQNLHELLIRVFIIIVFYLVSKQANRPALSSLSVKENSASAG
jgi:hypothetical protein